MALLHKALEQVSEFYFDEKTTIFDPRIVDTFFEILIFYLPLLLNFIRYEGQRIQLTHPRVTLPYIMYKYNMWVRKPDSLPFIPNKIEQKRGHPL